MHGSSARSGPAPGRSRHAAAGRWRRKLSGNGGRFNGWSPDGERIAFTGSGDESQQADVFVIGVDGTGLRNLTNDPADDLEALWIPAGR